MKVELFATGLVLGFGFRFGTFTVDLDGDGRIDAKDRDYRISTINDIVRRYNISHCVVQFVDKTVKEYAGPKPGCRVGKSPHSGTLGAFAYGGDGVGGKHPALYAIVSKHVTACQPDSGITVTFVDEGTPVQARLGDIKICKSALDIAAIKVDEPIKGSCDTSLRSLAGEPTMCKTFDFRSEDRLVQGLMDRQVYIHGATTSGGHGKITQPEYSDKSVLSPFVVVEDYNANLKDGQEDGRFSEPGDSGAVVCAEVPGKPYVEAISVIQGELTLRDTPTKSEESEATANVTPTIVEESGPHTGTVAASASDQSSNQQHRSETLTDRAVTADSGSKEETSFKPRRYLTIPLKAGLDQSRKEHGLEYLKLCNEITDDTNH